MITAKIKLFTYAILVFPHLLFYIFSKEKNKINKDIEVSLKLHRQNITINKYLALYRELVFYKEFRNIFYMRLGSRSSKFLSFFLPSYKFLSLGLNSENVGGGFLVQHGNSTIVLANNIGENFWVNQNVTVGWTEHGCPSIGNNVRIGTGAVVLGPITIGDNVNIGAGAIVLKSVPPNCTVVSPHAYIVKKDGVKVHIEL